MLQFFLIQSWLEQECLCLAKQMVLFSLVLVMDSASQDQRLPTHIISKLFNSNNNK